jgi:hypothetical protein
MLLLIKASNQQKRFGEQEPFFANNVLNIMIIIIFIPICNPTNPDGEITFLIPVT